MATPPRGSIRTRINGLHTLVAVDDLDGDTFEDAIDVTGAERVIYIQVSEAADNGAGVDVIVVSHDDGETWALDDTLLAAASDDITGTVVAALNAAGTEPALGAPAVFKGGPYPGPTMIACMRDTSAGFGTDWTTGAPGVFAIVVGGVAGGA